MPERTPAEPAATATRSIDGPMRRWEGESDSLRRMSQLSDVELMTAIAEGKETALEELYDRLGGQVFGLCLRILRQPSDAEVVLTEVFWQVWSRSESFNPDIAAPRTYIMMIARSRALDRKRAMTRDAARQTDLLDSNEGIAGELRQRGPLESAVVAEDCNRIRTALQSLTDPQRETIQLAYYEGLTHREIAVKVGKPLGTVKTLIRQAILKLRTRLKSPP